MAEPAADGLAELASPATGNSAAAHAPARRHAARRARPRRPPRRPVREAEQDLRRDLAALQSRAPHRCRPAPHRERPRVTAALLGHQLEVGIRAIDLRLTELASDHMLGPHAELLMVVRSSPTRTRVRRGGARALRRCAEAARPGADPLPRESTAGEPPPQRCWPAASTHSTPTSPARSTTTRSWPPAGPAWPGAAAWRERAAGWSDPRSARRSTLPRRFATSSPRPRRRARRLVLAARRRGALRALIAAHTTLEQAPQSCTSWAGGSARSTCPSSSGTRPVGARHR